MILQALNQYYERLQADPSNDIAPYGFSRQKISFCVCLEHDGSLFAFQPVVSEVVKGRPLPQSLVVPGQAKATGGGLNPCLLWDNATYMLGKTPEDHTAAWAAKRFEAFRDRHLSLENEICDEAFSAVCAFLKTWSPVKIAEHPGLDVMIRSFGVFRLKAAKGYVHERPAVIDWWRRQMGSTDGEAIEGHCLVTGKRLPLARLHEPKIKNVLNAQSSGAVLVSFNLDASDSYGKSKGHNAPTSQLAAFQYATALNRLLADRGRRIQIGDATTVFWTETPTPAEQLVPPLFANVQGLTEAEDEQIVQSIRSFLDRLREGKKDDLAQQLGDPKTQYYILGLSPNASRISIRFWQSGSLGELCKRLARHFCDLDIVGLDDHFPTIRDLLRETAPPKSGWPDEEKIPKPLATGLVNAVLTGQPYPMSLYSSLLRRIKSEQFVSHDRRKDWMRAMVVRAAAIKAILIHNFRKEIPVALDSTRPEPAYHLGRWFALLEKIQQEAHDNVLNATIKDRFYAAASSTPAAVFPRLIQLSQHHLRRQANIGLKTTREKQVQEVADQMASFPRQLSLENQGLFHLGYYHQVKSLYTKKNQEIEATKESE
jgi:CRISPR-associated protein Csd1